MVDIPEGAVSIGLDDLNKILDEWALPIGRFMMSFTSCEYWTYLYIGTFGSKKLREFAGDINLRSRVKIAQALVSDIGLNVETQARVDAAFTKLNALASKRNLIA